MKKKDDRKVKMKYRGKTPCKVPGIGHVEPNTSVDVPEHMSKNLARDKFWKIEKEQTTKGTKEKKDSKKNPPPDMPSEEKEVKDG